MVHSETMESTNDRGLELLDRGFPEGTLVLTEEQTRGRGRRGRDWISPTRRGIYASLLLRPAMEPFQLPLITFAASLAVARTLEAETGQPAGIKWPNDVQLRGKKAAGILAEARTFENHPAVVVGVGMNVNQEPEDFPEEFRSRATSLRMVSGRIGDRTGLVIAWMAIWEEEHRLLAASGGRETLDRWASRSALEDGAPVRVDLGGEILAGLYRGVSPSGEMLLEMKGAPLRRVAFGDVRRVGGEG
jgi:BirA family transcriptional regulator, biotin operon repressor / biotin---[acetyl-CoA-carboxylase] ligase